MRRRAAARRFPGAFAKYRELDRGVLELAVENTNLKAQRLAFGPAQQAADAFRDSLEHVASAAPAEGSLPRRRAGREGHAGGA